MIFSVTGMRCRLARSLLPLWLSETFTVFDVPAASVALAEPTVTVTLRVLACAVTEISLWPRMCSTSVILNTSRQVEPAPPLHEACTLAVVPFTFAWPTDAVPAPGGGGGGDAVVNDWSAPTNVPKSLTATTR